MKRKSFLGLIYDNQDICLLRYTVIVRSVPCVLYFM